MQSFKRATESLLSEDAPDVRILVIDREEPILAHSVLLNLLSQVVKDLPKASDCPTTWDLREVVLQGEAQPVKGTVVEQWLDCLYSRIDSARIFHAPNSLDDALSILIFADFAASAKTVMNDIVRARLDKPCLAVPLGESRSVELALRGSVYYCTSGGALMEIPVPRAGKKIITAIPSEEFSLHREQFISSLCCALEEWLHLAGRLGLVPLARLLLDFVKLHMFPDRFSIVKPALGSVFSPRVLRAMPAELLFEGFLHSAIGYSPNDALIDGAQVELTAPEAAAWFNGSSPGCALKPCDNKAGCELNNVRLFARVGGADSGECEAIVREALGKALEEQ